MFVDYLPVLVIWIAVDMVILIISHLTVPTDNDEFTISVCRLACLCAAMKMGCGRLNLKSIRISTTFAPSI